MKNKLLLFGLLSLLLFNSATGFSQAFEKGKMVISAGYGFPNLASALFKSYESNANYKASSLGPLFGKFEYGISDKIGLGFNYAYTNASLSYDYIGSLGNTYQENIDFTSMSFLVRMNFHFATGEKLDPYFGFGVGYKATTWTYTDNDPNSNSNTAINNPIPLGMEATIGLRYLFTPNIGAYAEAGFAKGLFQGGLVFAF